jgi:hypothetical protein
MHSHYRVYNWPAGSAMPNRRTYTSVRALSPIDAAMTGYHVFHRSTGLPSLTLLVSSFDDTDRVVSEQIYNVEPVTQVVASRRPDLESSHVVHDHAPPPAEGLTVAAFDAPPWDLPSRYWTREQATAVMS